jgi:hypothetical protein
MAHLMKKFMFPQDFPFTLQLIQKILNFKSWVNGYLNNGLNYRNPNLGLTTKARACKVVGQEGSSGVTFHAPRGANECEAMNPHIPK